MTNEELDERLLQYFETRKGSMHAWQTVGDVRAWALCILLRKEITYSRTRFALKRLAKQNKILESYVTFQQRTGPKLVRAYHHPKYL